MLIDGDLVMPLVTNKGTPYAWASVHLPVDTQVGYVAAYNRDDAWSSLTGAVEVWVGVDANLFAQKCGEISDTNSAGPFLIWCGSIGDVVTIRQKGPGSYLSLTELVAYSTTGALVEKS